MAVNLAERSVSKFREHSAIERAEYLARLREEYYCMISYFVQQQEHPALFIDSEAQIRCASEAVYELLKKRRSKDRLKRLEGEPFFRFLAKKHARDACAIAEMLRNRPPTILPGSDYFIKFWAVLFNGKIVNVNLRPRSVPYGYNTLDHLGSLIELKEAPKGIRGIFAGKPSARYPCITEARAKLEDRIPYGQMQDSPASVT